MKAVNESQAIPSVISVRIGNEGETRFCESAEVTVLATGTNWNGSSMAIGTTNIQNYHLMVMAYQNPKNEWESTDGLLQVMGGYNLGRRTVCQDVAMRHLGYVEGEWEDRRQA